MGILQRAKLVLFAKAKAAGVDVNRAINKAKFWTTTEERRLKADSAKAAQEVNTSNSKGKIIDQLLNLIRVEDVQFQNLRKVILKNIGMLEHVVPILSNANILEKHASALGMRGNNPPQFTQDQVKIMTEMTAANNEVHAVLQVAAGSLEEIETLRKTFNREVAIAEEFLTMTRGQLNVLGIEAQDVRNELTLDKRIGSIFKNQMGHQYLLEKSGIGSMPAMRPGY